MTYSNKYYAGWASPKGMQGYLYIDEKEYVGTATEIKLLANSLIVEYVFDDWNNPIFGLQCYFEIINNKTDFYELLPLLIAQESQYKVRVICTHPTSYSLFEGFLNVDTVSQKYLHLQPIKFVASSFLNKLQYFHPISVDTLQNSILINTIDEILRSTGAEYDIMVNSKIHAEGDRLLAGQTLFNKNGFYTEIFWENEVERTSCLDILKIILTSFDCYIYWKNSAWYIERYEDIYEQSIDFVKYVTGTSYTTESQADVINEVKEITDIHDLIFTEQSQTLSIIPGLKTIKINLKDSRVLNLVTANLALVTGTTSDVPAPPYREYFIWDGGGLTWLEKGLPKSNITNAIHRGQSLQAALPIYRGIQTTFKVTIDKEDVQLNIKFKYYLDLPKITGWTKKWEDYSVDFNWFCRISDSNYYLIRSGEDWKTEYGLPSGVIDNQMQLDTFSGSSFNPNTKTVEVSLTIPIGLVKTYFDNTDTGLLKGDVSLVFGLGLERLHVKDEENLDGVPVEVCSIGDFNITTTGSLQDNVIEGNVNISGFLNKKEISMTLYDMHSYNYKNGILRTAAMLIRTERWGVSDNEENIIQKGVCWSTSHNPTIANDKTDNGTGYGVFESNLSPLLPNTLYYARAYYMYASTVVYANEISFTTAAIKVGDYYQGGIIFYILHAGDIGYNPLVTHGLIASIADQTANTMSGVTSYYGSLSGGAPYSPGCFNYAIGTGLINSNLMLANDRCKDQAVKLCKDYSYGGFSDWFLPSIEELRQLYLQESVIGGFEIGSYWSSSEVSESYNYKWAQCVPFNILGVSIGDLPYVYSKKNENLYVRAIRSF